LNIYPFFLNKKMLFSVFLVLAASQFVGAQVWMEGYNFRKKITVDKSKISGTSNFQNFNILIELEAADLKDILSCSDELVESSNLPISFASGKESGIPIGFQLDSYDPGSGKLRCWVQVTELISANNPGTNEMYFYYGGNKRHDPLSLESRAIWIGNYRHVWHMNFDKDPAISFSANHSSGNNIIGNSGMNAGSFVQGVVGTGISFNGVTDYMHSVADKEPAICISGWIRLAQTGTDQVILANDSAVNGYQIKINTEGKVVFDILNMGIVNSHSTVATIPVNTWTYLTLIFAGNQKKIYIDGVYKGGGGSPSSRGGIGETISIGRSKQHDKYFNGVIDELRIAHIERSAGWILTEYRNQINPGSFISVSDRAVNPVQVTNTNEFTGANGTDDWQDERNWSLLQLPGKFNDVVIPTGKEVHLNIGHTVSLNRLFLQQGALMVLSGNLEVNCIAQLAAASSIYLNNDAHLILKNELLNDGTIFSGQYSGTLGLKGKDALQVVSGSGAITVARLEVNLASPFHTILFNTQINISRQLLLLKGILNANGKLTLLASGNDNYAAVAPVEDVHQASVVGNVNIQQFIDGNFSGPSTARGWWLLSAPVYHSLNVLKEYHLHAIQESVFVTGPGGVMNGFDSSPKNNPTIYTHNQALPGTLSQKYTGIPHMDVSIPLGKGIYMFSRGSRRAPNAYEHQVQQPPFSNPGPYVITHTGQLLTGDLKIDLFNNNTDAVGDGYNLIGNPYASAITWGGIQKTNVSPYVWAFNPKNNAYVVTDDPAYIIPMGSGFFVKVNNGAGTGAVTFTESSKYATAPVTTFNKLASVQTHEDSGENVPSTKIKVDLKKDGLSDEYVLILRKGSDNGITDADAQKIGEGHLSISGLASNGHKLAIDERELDSAGSKIQLFVKGWTSGAYMLSLKMSLNRNEQIILLDHYLNKRITVGVGDYYYPFSIDTENSETYGNKRFSLLISTREKLDPANVMSNSAFLFYPNPVNDVLYLKSMDHAWRNLEILVRTITGNVIWKGELPMLEAGIPAPIPFYKLNKGLYFLQLIDGNTNKTMASFKMLKN
jgi:hypothetical protein